MHNNERTTPANHTPAQLSAGCVMQLFIAQCTKSVTEWDIAYRKVPLHRTRRTVL